MHTHILTSILFCVLKKETTKKSKKENVSRNTRTQQKQPWQITNMKNTHVQDTYCAFSLCRPNFSDAQRIRLSLRLAWHLQDFSILNCLCVERESVCVWAQVNRVNMTRVNV